MDSQIIKELAAIKQELNDKLPVYLNQALDKVGFRIIPKAQLDQIRLDLSMEEKEKKNEFLAMFPGAFLSLLHNLLQEQNSKMLGLNIKPPEPRTVSELFSQSFFPSDYPSFRKHSVLETIVQDMNQSIHKFYMLKKGKLQELIELQKEIDNQVLPSTIQQFIKKDQEQRKLFSIKKQEEKMQSFSKSENIQPPESEQQQQPLQENQTIQNEENNNNTFQNNNTNIIVKKDANEPCPHCICSRTTFNAVPFNQSAQSHQIQCRICDHFYHTNCLRITNINYRQFICPDCILLKLDQLHKVVEILCDAVPFQPTNHAPLKSLTFKLRDKVSTQAVEVRCIKLDGKAGSEEPTWPDIGDLSMNGRKVLDFKPLLNNSSLKKRKDEKFTTQDVLYNATNTIIIREGSPNHDQKMNCRVQLGQNYYIGIYLVRRFSPDGLLKEIKDNVENWVSMQSAKQFIKLYVQQTGTDDVSIQSLKVSFICSFDTRLIETPARGLLCEHLQCFSLENMIKMMHSVHPRRWRCPICKSKCFGLQIDGYQTMILDLIRRDKLDIEEITFDTQGEIETGQLKEILNLPETQEQFPHHYIDNDNRVYSIESLEKKLLQPQNIKSDLVKGFRFKRVIELDDDEEEKTLEPKLKKNQCSTLKIFLNYEPEEKVMTQVFGKKNKLQSKGYTSADPINVD